MKVTSENREKSAERKKGIEREKPWNEWTKNESGKPFASFLIKAFV